MKKTCVQCKKEFMLTDSEIAFYKNKSLSLPKRCKECRDVNRKTNAGMNIEKPQKNYSKDITVDTKTVKNRKSQNKKNNSFFYMIALIVVLVIGLGVLFSSGDSSNDKSSDSINNQQYSYNFSSQEALNSHFQKHGHEFGYTTVEQYLQGAIRVIENPSSLKKTEAEDGDYVYYLQSTNEIVFVSSGGVIKTYFKPTDEIAYFNRQQVVIFDFVGLINSNSYTK